MKTKSFCALFFTCALAAPSFGQQKTFNWIPGNDETVSLDPGYFHGGPTYQPGAQTRDVHVDVEAQRPVTIAMTSDCFTPGAQYSRAADGGFPTVHSPATHRLAL